MNTSIPTWAKLMLWMGVFPFAALVVIGFANVIFNFLPDYEIARHQDYSGHRIQMIIYMACVYVAITVSAKIRDRFIAVK